MRKYKGFGLDNLRDGYALRNISPEFSKGYRQNIRYAIPTYNVHLDTLNPNGIEPFDYLNFAKEDLSSGGTRGAINALGNVKRAVHITIDKLLWTFGLSKSYSRSNFPEKLEIISELEVFPVGLIKILNKERNFVEHEYTTIGIDQVEQYTEITELLLLVSYPLLRNSVVGAVFGIDDSPDCYEWVMDFNNCILTLNQVKHDKYISTEIGPIHYNYVDDRVSNQIERFSITKKNKAKWLQPLNLFAYLTKVYGLKLSSEKTPEGYSYTKTNHTVIEDL